MSSFVIVQNRITVLLGPMPWRQRMFQSEINDLVDQGELSERFIIPPVEQGYINIGNGIEIFPVGDSYMPEHDTNFQQAAGPFRTFDNNIAVPSYTVQDLDINIIKGNLKQLAASERYRKEVSGSNTVVQGSTVTLDTSRDGRNIFVQKLMLMSDTDTVNWKFPETWLTLTKQDLANVVSTGAAYIQSQFNWEQDISAQVDSATTIEELRLINIIEPLNDIIKA